MKTLVRLPKDIPLIEDPKQLKAEGEALMQSQDKSLQKLRELPSESLSFENLAQELDRLAHEAASFFSCVYLVQNVHADESLRNAARELSTAFDEWQISRSYDPIIYQKFCELKAKKPELKPEQQRLLDRQMKDYERMGMSLPEKDRDELKAWQTRLSELAIQYSKAINDSNLKLLVNEEELQGLDENFIASLPREDGKCRLSLEYPIYVPCMEYAEREELREKLFRLKLQVAKEENPRLLKEVLELRKKISAKLGYASWADFIVSDRMAKTPDRVVSFLEDLSEKLEGVFESEKQDLQKMKREHTNQPQAELQIWDVSFYKSLAIKKRFQVDSLKIKEFFPLEEVLKRMFRLVESLFGLKIEEESPENGPRWHPEAKLYRVNDQDGAFIGRFYLDLHPRPGKYNHAAVFGLIYGRALSPQDYQAPVYAMVCNFPRPHADRPSLLSHSDVETLFHEFGHLLHGVLTRASFFQLAGTHVTRDFVEAPSQVMENWVWEEISLVKLSSHFQTGEALPKTMIEKMRASKLFGMALHTRRQISFALTDLELHGTAVADDPEKIYRSISKKLFFPIPEDSRFLAGFAHLMGYDAGYYGYAWADVMAADIFSRFKEDGVLNAKLGQRLREEIYEKGSSRDEEESLVAFLQRPLSNQAFFESLGVSNS